MRSACTGLNHAEPKDLRVELSLLLIAKGISLLLLLSLAAGCGGGGSQSVVSPATAAKSYAGVE
jgi:hypothetical protein